MKTLRRIIMRVLNFIRKIVPFLAPPPPPQREPALYNSEHGSGGEYRSRAIVGRELVRHRHRRRVLHRIARASRQRNARGHA